MMKFSKRSFRATYRRLLEKLRERIRSGQPRHLRTGMWGEALAARHLGRKGYKILGQRVRVGSKDEIDLIARQGQTLVFIEVKTRANEMWGRPLAAVDRQKRDRLGRAAMRYMMRLRRKPPTFRFDVVEIVGQEGADPAEIRHVENVFGLPKGLKVPW